METICVDEIAARRDQANFQILRIDVQLPLDQLKRAISSILTEFKPAPKDDYQTYAGLGLQYANPANPIYDAVAAIAYLEPGASALMNRDERDADFRSKNVLARRLKFVFDSFPGIDLFRGRILCAGPNHIHLPHTDGSNSCRIHIPVVTNDHCKMYFGGEGFHLDASGAAYLCNTSIPHHFENLGSCDRIHIVFCL